MSAEVVTKEDLQVFRLLLLEDLKKVISAMQPEEKPEWLKSGDVRKILNVSPNSLQNLRINGQLHPKKISGSWYYSMPEIKALFKTSK
jgi:hypothetical protein